MRTLTTRVVALGLVLAACSPAAEPTTTTTSTTTTTPTTTTTQSTTTTTVPEVDSSPVTGLPLEDPELGERRVLAVKIDNHTRSIPQSGIDDADMVIEMLVEGITRFLTLWMESDSEYLGPMRSGRPTDGTLLAALNHPTFARSGAQEWVAAVTVLKDVHQIGEIGPPATLRVRSRRAPHNLYVDTIALREAADRRNHPDEAPEPIWEFGPIAASAAPASTISLRFGANLILWEWDPAESTWLRSAYGTESMWEDREGNTGRLEASVLVVLLVQQYIASPPPGWTGSAVPASQTVGSGQAFVFAEGKAVEGTWEREEEAEWFTLKDAAGNVIPVPPGRAWVSLVPTAGGVTYEP